MKKSYRYILLALAVLALDRISKYAALTWCADRCQINNYLAFDLAFNRGISWGFFHSTNDLLFIIVSAAIACLTAIVAQMGFARYKQGLMAVGETLVVAGSIGNLVDRLWYYGVIDFIELSYTIHTWPLFNIADVCIVVGVGIMLVEYYRS
jgi:signal peptidase II